MRSISDHSVYWIFLLIAGARGAFSWDMRCRQSSQRKSWKERAKTEHVWWSWTQRFSENHTRWCLLTTLASRVLNITWAGGKRRSFRPRKCFRFCFVAVFACRAERIPTFFCFLFFSVCFYFVFLFSFLYFFVHRSLPTFAMKMNHICNKLLSEAMENPEYFEIEVMLLCSCACSM